MMIKNIKLDVGIYLPTSAIRRTYDLTADEQIILDTLYD